MLRLCRLWINNKHQDIVNTLLSPETQKSESSVRQQDLSLHGLPSEQVVSALHPSVPHAAGKRATCNDVPDNDKGWRKAKTG